jgi:hypothetical protein
MAAIFSFKCSSCSELHEGSPSFAFRAPDPYLEQPKEVQEAGKLGSDLCWYEDEDGMHYFIRVCLEVPICGVTDPFMWGVWVSLSKKSFDRYVETYDAPDTTDQYFGFLCNYLPAYPNSYALKSQVHPRAGNDRPYIVLEKTDHPLSVDFHQGITIQRAQEIAEQVMHR